MCDYQDNLTPGTPGTHGWNPWALGAHTQSHLFSRPRERGVAMLLVLIAVAMATILSMSFLSSQATSLGVAKNVQGHAQARSVAESALVVAINYVQTDANWRTDKTDGQWVSNVSFNGGTFDLYGYDGLDTDGDGVVDDTDGDLADDPSDPVTLKVVADVDGVSHTVFAAVTVGSGSITKRVLMIVADAGNLDPKESGRQGMIEGWGWAVDILDDGASQADYDTAVGLVDGVLVPGTVNASTVGTKLNNASVGVVIEEGGLADDLKISSSFGSYTGTSVNVVNSSHYITSAFGSGLVVVSSAGGTMEHPGGTLASGGQSLAESPDGSVSAVVALEPGAALYGGGIAAGRRVSIPTGDFLATDLTADGEELIKRALTWTGGGEADGFISGQWALDEAGGLIAYDSSGNGQNGPITAGDPSTQWTAGKVFGGLRFDGTGDGFVRIPDSDVLDLAEAGTLSAWIYLDGYSNFMGIIHKGENKNWSDEAYSLQFWTSRRIAMSFTTSSGGKLIVGSQQLQNGQWYHVVGTWGTNGMAIYINGVLDASNSTTAVGVASIGSVQIGSQLSEYYNSSYKNFPFNGVIDDARIYRRTLTAAEVKDAYNQAIVSSDTPQLIALYEFQEVVPPPPALVGHWQLDELGGGGVPSKVYWYNKQAIRLQQADLDGSNVVDLATGFETKHLTIDSAGGKLYWFNKQAKKLQRADLSGANIQDLATGVDVKALALDPAGGKVYWSQKTPFQVTRANLDGSGAQVIASGFEAKQMIVDPGGGKLYWFNKQANKIQRSNLDGTNVQDVVAGLGSGVLDVQVMVLDPVDGKIYWLQEQPFQVMRANLDGSNAQVIVSGVEAEKMVLDPVGGKLYWFNEQAMKLQRSNLDGTNIQDLATGVDVKTLTLDPTGGKLYWSQKTPFQVTRANLDGTGAQVIASGFEAKELLLNGGGSIIVATDAVAGNNGNSFGGTTGGAAGNGDGGTAFQFDGVDGYVQVAHDPAYLLNDGAVSFWFKPDDLVGHHAMFSKDSTNFDTGGHLHIYTEGTTLKARLQSTSADYIVQSSGLSVGNWYQVTVSFGSGGLKLYLDGVLVDSDSYTGGLGSNSGGIGNHEPIAIGAGTWTSDDLAITPITYPFAGSIDDVRIYDRGFDDTQALDLFNGNTPASGPATVVYDTSGFGAPLNLNIETPGNVSWLAGGGLQFDTATKVVSPTAATKLYNAITATNQMTLEVIFTPANVSQNGPARIVSYSGGVSSRNFTFGQETDAYITRLRTAATTSNGTPDINSPSVLVAGIQEHVIVSYDGANVTMYRNGAAEVTTARTGDFNWDNTFKLILGDEVTGGRDWLGSLSRVAIYDKAFNATQAGNVFAGSPPGDGSNSVGATDWIER